LTHVQKKVTWLRLCESPFNPRGKFGFHLQEPKISSFPLYAILVMKDEFDAYFKICILQIILGHKIGLPYASEAPSYQTLDLMDLPSWNSSTMLLTWKFKHSHWKLKSIIKLPLSIQECYFMSPWTWAWACSMNA
jgi:hypothetical protein